MWQAMGGSDDFSQCSTNVIDVSDRNWHSAANASADTDQHSIVVHQAMPASPLIAQMKGNSAMKKGWPFLFGVLLACGGSALGQTAPVPLTDADVQPGPVPEVKPEAL